MVRTPASLLERLKRPEDKEAWQRFVRLYTPMIHRWAVAAGLESNDANDLTQEVFLTLIRVLPEFVYDPHKSFRGWLKTVAINRLRDSNRRLQGKRRLEHAAIDRITDENDTDPAKLFEEADYRQYLVGRAMQLIQTDFEPTTWQIWKACVVMGQPPRDVAERFGVTVNAVYLTKARVLRRLREELDGFLT